MPGKTPWQDTDGNSARMAEEMERHFGPKQIGKGRVGGVGVTTAGNALVAQVIEGIPCQQVFGLLQTQASGVCGIDGLWHRCAGSDVLLLHKAAHWLSGYDTGHGVRG